MAVLAPEELDGEPLDLLELPSALVLSIPPPQAANNKASADAVTQLALTGIELSPMVQNDPIYADFRVDGVLFPGSEYGLKLSCMERRFDLIFYLRENCPKQICAELQVHPNTVSTINLGRHPVQVRLGLRRHD